MDFITLAKERYSCRKFKPAKVEQDKIDLILEAGIVAPTAVNKQPQKVLVITDEDKISKIKECTKYHFDAPLYFVICTDKEKAYTRGYDGKNSAEIDASIVTTHMMLEAQDLGLGTTWVMVFDPEKVKKEFNIPEELEVLAILPTGYPADDAVVNPLHNKFADYDELVTYNEFK